jgi:hypothetical protein
MRLRYTAVVAEAAVLSPGQLQVGSTTWTHAHYWDAQHGADDEDEEYGVQECATCGEDVDLDDLSAWVDDDSGNAVHENCEIPVYTW